jgi:hypothetical protein
MEISTIAAKAAATANTRTNVRATIRQGLGKCNKRRSYRNCIAT